MSKYTLFLSLLIPDPDFIVLIVGKKKESARIFRK